MIYWMIIILIAGMDIAAKYYIDRHRTYGKETTVWNGKLTITKQYNKGAFLNLMEKKDRWVRIISTAMLMVLMIYFVIQQIKHEANTLLVGLSFLIGGAISNSYDRIVRTHVIDYLILNYKKLKHIVFNIGDVCILIGAAILILRSLCSRR